MLFKKHQKFTDSDLSVGPLFRNEGVLQTNVLISFTDYTGKYINFYPFYGYSCFRTDFHTSIT